MALTKEELRKEFESVVRWQYGDTRYQLSSDYVRLDSFKEFLKRVIDKLEPEQFDAFSITFGSYDEDDELGEIELRNDLEQVEADFDDYYYFFNLGGETGYKLLEDKLLDD